MCQIQVHTHSKTRVQIPTRDYNIDRSEVEMLCRYSNSRAPGDYSTQRNLLNKNPTQPKSTHNLQENAKVPRHGFLAQKVNGRVWAPNPGGKPPHHQACNRSSDVG